MVIPYDPTVSDYIGILVDTGVTLLLLLLLLLLMMMMLLFDVGVCMATLSKPFPQ